MRLNQPADAESNGRATDPPSIIDLCDAYLATLHSGSWGRTFYIHDAAGRRAAAEFLATTIEGVMEHAKQR